MTSAGIDVGLAVIIAVAIGLAWLAGIAAIVFAVIAVAASKRRRRK